jgi:hypothetical protein
MLAFFFITISQHTTRADVSSNNPASTQYPRHGNEVPPRTVANSAKEISQNKQRAGVSSNNPAPAQTK